MTIEEIKKELNCNDSIAEYIENNQSKILDLLNNRFIDSNYFFNSWHIDDIKQQDANNIENGYDELNPLTDYEIQQCRQQILKNLDANSGITWDAIDYAIETIKEDRIKNILKELDITYKKYFRYDKQFGNSTWVIKDNILLYDNSEEEKEDYLIFSYDEITEDKEILFSGNIEQCLDYSKTII